MVVFFIFIIPIKLKINLKMNAIRNIGIIKIKLFGFLTVYNQKFEINNGFIKLIKNPEKIKQIKLSFKKEDVKKFNNTFNVVIASQIIKNIDILTKFGLKHSPVFVSLISAIYNTVLGIFASINMANGNILNLNSHLKTYFDYTYLKTNINLNIKFSLYQLLSLFLQIKLGVS